MTNIIELAKELPEGYEAACYTEKAVQRKRGICNPSDLMLLSLFHLLNGCSLVEISTIASLAKLGKISDVGFMKRFEGCNDWFMWITSTLLFSGSIDYQIPEWLSGYRVLAADASDVVEKGRSGRIYRLHFALDLFKMQCAEYSITSESVGESLKNFHLRPNDLVIGDRIYSTFVGMKHCIKSGANFVMRLRSKSFNMYNLEGEKINLLEEIKPLSEGENIDLPVYVEIDKGERTAVRICVIKKNIDAQIKTQNKLEWKESKKQDQISEYTKQFNKYTVLVTMLPSEITAEQIFELYSWRWQVEMYFKRLKSILDFGELPKKRPKSVFTWLNGKIMIAVLIEKLVGKQPFPPKDK
jgi:hypothetical protein